MKKRNIVVLLAVVGAAYLALKGKKQAEATAGAAGVTPSATVSETPMVEPVVHLVEETLHQHEGEDSPIVHAFEEALEEKAGHGA